MNIVAQIGEKVIKKSKKPFKSGFKIGTVVGYCEHPVTSRVCYMMQEDNTYVETFRCRYPTAEEIQLHEIKLKGN